ncbi:hypothetical protein [Lentzea cavernae]|uniref:hypothetical protein n=1 Tax=Lentzea cavernae TaxID=2020703 RepID=UPI00174B3132|nr:hypothetical protein [Lentzea cavernae]
MINAEGRSPQIQELARDFEFGHLPTPVHSVAHMYRVFAAELIDSIPDDRALAGPLDRLLTSRDGAVGPAVIAQRELVRVLAQIEEHDQNYDVRYRLVWQAAGLARDVGYDAGIRIDPNEPEWPVVYIELPDAQVSWHMPQHPVAWDGHDTEEKYRRVRAFVQAATS